MPVKLRNKITKNIIDVNVSKVNTIYKDNLWEPVLQKDIIEVYELKGIYRNEKYIKGKFEKDEGLKLLTENPNLFFDIVPDFDLLSLPNQNSATLLTKDLKKENLPVTTFLNLILNRAIKILNYDYVKLIITGIIVGLFLLIYGDYRKIKQTPVKTNKYIRR